MKFTAPPITSISGGVITKPEDQVETETRETTPEQWVDINPEFPTPIDDVQYNEPAGRIRELEIIPQAFNAEWCQELVEFMESHPSYRKGTVGFANDGATDGAEESEVRNSDIAWLEVNCDYSHMVHTQVEQFMKQQNLHRFGFQIESLEPCQYTSYTYDKDSPQHYDWHIDSFLGGVSGSMAERKLSCSIQLSDPSTYEGGNLEVGVGYTDDAPRTEAMREQGTCILFPSFTPHRVTPVTKGTRKSLVIWAVGPDWR